jgi:hypothetical protein
MADMVTTVKGRDYDVTVAGDGVFYTTDANGNRCHAESLKELRGKLGRVASRVSVPYTRVSTTWSTAVLTTVDGELTGVHSDGRRVLGRENGRAQQFGGHETSGFLRRLNEEQKSELQRLSSASIDAKAALDRFISQNRMNDVYQVIKDAAKGAGDEA